MLSKRSFLAGAAGLCLGELAPAADPYADARSKLLAEIQGDLRDTASSTGRREFDPAVLAAMASVPRHRFVPPPLAPLAYVNRPLAIGHGQTISQPFIVALMTQLIDPKPTDRVLEIGTGSGYQAAVLAKLVARVHTIEIVRPLGERAAELLRELGHANVEVRIGDGYRGWPEAAPFDAIVVTAAPDRMPQPLIDQLAPGGRLIAPIGPQGGAQDLLLLRKDPDGRVVTRSVLPVRFVPLTRN
ncbi:MAG TPA: protein-L-isoaspartate(D-aspartate) O-methyltransferase [Caldimonas sp.]|jgi:protein-L-isoaspartate(D-aspartate) O-methyltransferase|nr:protein-L-isoaspartate(D-aspartate) O-methyltransferase [Caldimonas sp.]HEX2542914.1 protein-L-isoaspartate(D-aspartate) O-methyltransferase [Caldimonas sp.]